MRKIIRNTLHTLKNLKHIIRYGGVYNINCKSVNCHEQFSADDLVLITGGTRGIGRSIAETFISAGATVVVTGRNAETRKVSDRLYSVRWDVTEICSIEERLDEIECLTGMQIRVLINNAGVYSNYHFPNCTEEDWDKVYATNVKGPFFLIQSIVKRWLQQPRSDSPRKIINISSQGGCTIANNPYRMTKWDLRGFTAFLGKTYSEKNIIANAIAPGLIMTDMQKEFQKQKDNYYTEMNPSKRLAKSQEIADLVLFLASDSANFIVGQTIKIEGGGTPWFRAYKGVAA